MTLQSAPGEVIVAGGINIDTLAVSTATTVAGTSNPGRTTRSHGGVGRNIAENLARLGTPTRLVSAVGTDRAGDEVLTALAELGIDAEAVRRTAHGTGSYTAILEPTGELVLGIADMAATESLSPDDVAGLDGAWLVLDGNLMPATVAHAVLTAHCPVLLDPVGVAKAARLGEVRELPLHTFTPNVAELAAFTGIDDETAAVAECHRRGIETVWVRDGSHGSRLHRAGRVTEIPVVSGPIVDVTGAGDSMLAGYTHRLHGGADVVEAARFGSTVAALTIASHHSVRPDLNHALVMLTQQTQEVR